MQFRPSLMAQNMLGLVGGVCSFQFGHIVYIGPVVHLYLCCTIGTFHRLGDEAAATDFASASHGMVQEQGQGGSCRTYAYVLAMPSAGSRVSMCCMRWSTKPMTRSNIRILSQNMLRLI